MDFLPESIVRLIEEFQQLPGIGPKSAQRLAFHLLKASDGRLEGFGAAVKGLKDGVVSCSTCFSLTTENPCRICSDARRDQGVLCVVESTLDLIAIEKTGEYRGLYHVLQGKLSPLDGIGPEDLRAFELFERVSAEGSTVREVILALNPDLEGDTTALFLRQKLTSWGELAVSRIARGIPSGGNLEYTDDATLIRAMQGRQSM
jgi:recombination protein RecR